jgi:UDP-3-O-[3-hydroxymyristoyl] N-acetylglucosamine deacetylase
MTYRKKTLKEEAEFEGRGLHTGHEVIVTVRPSENGIRFRYGASQWEARPEHVTDTTRSTRLGDIGTVEHLMAAFAGLGITDADVEVTSPEMPALDGCSAAYVQGLLASGLVETSEAECQPPFTRVFVHDGDVKISISAGTGHWRYVFECGDRWPYKLEYETENISEDFEKQIAPARTFGFEEEIPVVQAAGLAKGLDLDNALVLGQDDFLNPPLFYNEPPRHKMLDALGDLYLAGIPVHFLNVTAERTGHTVNVKAAMLLAEATPGDA